jgi:dipeptidyl-peptidase 4
VRPSRANRSIAALALLGALGWPGPASAEVTLQKLTPERLHADPPLAGVLPSGLAWHPDGRRLTYLRRKPGDAPADLFAFDVEARRESLLLAGSRVLHPSSGKPLPLGGCSWSPDGEHLLVVAEGDVFLVEARTGAVRALTRTPEAEEYAELSPDGRRVAFVRKGDLYSVDVASGHETRLTKTGSDTVLNGRLDWVYEEELASRSGKGFIWSPDSRAIAYLQIDQARVPTFPIVDFLPLHGDVQNQRYPLSGDPNPIVRVGVVGLERDGAAGPERLVSFAPDDIYVVPELAFSPDGRLLAFEHLNREQNELELRLITVPDSPTAALGAPRTIVTEGSDTWVNALPAPLFLKDGKRFLWISERSGFAHLHLCDLAGTCRAVTQGQWMVDAIGSSGAAAAPFQVEERTGFVYFTATEKDPRERHLYRTRLDGTGRARLTREDGTHRVLLSPDGRYYADTRSTAATVPSLVVSSTDGTRNFAIAPDQPSEIGRYERGTLEWAEVKAADGTVLYGRLLKPPAFDPARRYPVVVHLYGGPGAQVVRNAWGSASGVDHLLASQGFLVWSLDNRGSTGRGHAFESPIFHDLGRIELQDQLAGVEYLKSLPWVDPARIGITGWSYGGYLTLYALTHAPGVFKAGVAGAPVTDWTFYDSIYTERYMGTPRSNPQGYETSSPLKRAGDLRAELLIIHGTADDNVHLANTVSFVDALAKAGRPYLLNVHPRQRHGFDAKENRVAADTALLRHFEQWLK